MAIAPPIILNRPAAVSFSKNQLLYRFFLFNSTDDGCQLDIKILMSNTSISITYQTQSYPDANGNATVYIDDIVDSVLSYTIPDYSGGLFQQGTNTCSYLVQYRRISTANPNPAWVTDMALFAIKGGIELSKADYNNYFWNILPSTAWNTWQPGKCFAGLYDKFFLSFLLVNGMGGVRVLVTAEWTDNSTDNIYKVFSVGDVPNSLYYIKAGADALGINAIAAGRVLWRYSLTILKSDGSVIGAPYFIYADYRSFYKTKIFNYFNSLGGIDHIRLLGDQEDDYTRDYVEGEVFTGTVNVGQPPSTQYLQTNISRLNTYKNDAGYRHRINDVMPLQEIFTSASIWEITTSRNLRIWILNKSDTLKKKSDKTWGFALQWRYAFTEQVYTPVDIDLGSGQNTYVYPGCPVPTIGIISVDETTDTGQQVTFGLTPPSDGVVMQVNYKLTSESLWIALDPGVYTVFLLAGIYNLRIQAICAPGFVSPFVNSAEPFIVHTS